MKPFGRQSTYISSLYYPIPSFYDLLLEDFSSKVNCVVSANESGKSNFFHVVVGSVSSKHDWVFVIVDSTVMIDAVASSMFVDR
ncbi:hypothetical protein H5410_026655 [Solanum commersonii]|uniref:Uncharacterized protein n=1 Tax=Solanum commersonii TaxID=4109 RepID=A0A9J5YWR2_SOLCO|nr:hypothetical protein H5410_026655 [Solanum commersonii]